jgi:hypothetical protein
VITLLLACAPADTRPDIVVNPVTTVTTTVTETVIGSTATPTSTAPGGPRIEAVDLVEHDDVLEVRVSTSRGEAPLLGGVLLLTVDDGEALELDIPDDLGSFVDGQAVLLVDRPHMGECSVGADHEVGVELLDSEGRSSGRERAALTTSDVGLILPESGDSSAPELGLVPNGTLFCSDLDSVGNNGTAYTADRDFVAFEVPSNADWTLELRWDAVGDYDLYVYEIASDGYWDLVDSDHDPDVHGPEAVTTFLGAGHTYAVQVAGWSGDPGDWTVELAR